MPKGLKYHLSLLLRGMAMGAADVIPGVSGGTIAFITGIYAELIDSLRRCDYLAIKCLLQEGVAPAWRHINGNFLLAVFGGVLLSVFSLARLVIYCLEAAPVLVWSFFFGLVLAASIHMLRQLPGWSPGRLLLLLVGITTALIVSSLKPSQLPDSGWMMMLAGAIAICAMILPGISGGFLLLMMGMYGTVVGAVSELKLMILLPFALGCGVGLLLFSHVLNWLLVRFEAATMALLTGFLMGSLNMIWPWKQVLEVTVNRHGVEIPLQQNILPAQFYESSGEPAQLLLAVLLCVAGVALVFMMEFCAKSLEKKGGFEL